MERPFFSVPLTKIQAMNVVDTDAQEAIKDWHY